MSAAGCDHPDDGDAEDIEAERADNSLLGRNDDAACSGRKLSCLATEFPHRGKSISGHHGGSSSSTGIARDNRQYRSHPATQAKAGRVVGVAIRGRRGHMLSRSGSPRSASKVANRVPHTGSRGGTVKERGNAAGSGGGVGLDASTVAPPSGATSIVS
ncbi:unnamed protein product, partial [Sphacelaria rigidula]